MKRHEVVEGLIKREPDRSPAFIVDAKFGRPYHKTVVPLKPHFVTAIFGLGFESGYQQYGFVSARVGQHRAVGGAGTSAVLTRQLVDHRVRLRYELIDRIERVLGVVQILTDRQKLRLQVVDISLTCHRETTDEGEGDYERHCRQQRQIGAQRVRRVGPSKQR